MAGHNAVLQTLVQLGTAVNGDRPGCGVASGRRNHLDKLYLGSFHYADSNNFNHRFKNVTGPTIHFLCFAEIAVSLRHDEEPPVLPASIPSHLFRWPRSMARFRLQPES
ncbi:hypothetical protein SAMN05421770_101990 [Granulicella rosea]|uniref:Uncharacterized protein n=1 Tax=Granulicella rosea TaxID=474952 RepID=A0A239EK48_9BACT|nr:hypothetical protein SAMN05421770_101990 [Granulicella rosea]